MSKSYSLEEFKTLFKSNNPLKQDIIDIEHGKMVIHKSNINKYLEEYACCDEEDLSDTLWYFYGVLVNVIE